ncbi:BatA domain-containing protein, partial [bacterium]|nr:BatA domain-containing protein [bacterium]
MFGFSFLNSLFLWGIAAASIPVIIHLIKRNKAVKLPFAAIRFLQIEPNRRVKSQKLKQLILLLMRMAALVLLALAFARPFMAGAGAGGIWGEESKAAVVLIDNSFSMGYDNRLQAAKNEARNLIRSLKSGDQATV